MFRVCCDRKIVSWCRGSGDERKRRKEERGYNRLWRGSRHSSIRRILPRFSEIFESLMASFDTYIFAYLNLVLSICQRVPTRYKISSLAKEYVLNPCSSREFDHLWTLNSWNSNDKLAGRWEKSCRACTNISIWYNPDVKKDSKHEVNLSWWS